MNFKLKMIAAAAAMVVAGGASAAPINNGANGNGDLFFNIWDRTGSYTRNLGIDLNSFETLVATGKTNLVFGADTLLTSFLGTHTGALNWNVLATDKQGAVRVLETAQAAAKLTNKDSNIVVTAAGQTTALVTGINSKLAASNSAIYGTADTGYINRATSGSNVGISVINNNIGWTTAALGTLNNNSFANGLLLKEALGNATGITAIQIATLGGGDTRAWFKDGTLTIAAAVPEPESYAMLLAGLGMLGFMARRRLSNRA
ncbi:PEP-CTERM sorting domain-containing protein [Rhodocyclus gracilis]|uniref:PEP-CTERM sorting domain-containing protein n=1 Tax=Rhodocyclus tenuis TaxID=1066 RepID=A0A6L5JW37_RHOTE|nr:PEP-CTERM sorting domain-containing protein [Rhodocyclus gracilis]MQY51002.1 PEP-CTERM sorting domain-containing protein [Rhodocyclus gracilis]